MFPHMDKTPEIQLNAARKMNCEDLAEIAGGKVVSFIVLGDFCNWWSNCLVLVCFEASAAERKRKFIFLNSPVMTVICSCLINKPT